MKGLGHVMRVTPEGVCPYGVGRMCKAGKTALEQSTTS